MANAREFALELDGLFDEEMEKVRERLIDTAIYAKDIVKRRTPKDTGQAQNNWLVSFGSPDGRTVQVPADLDAESMAALAAYPKEGWPTIILQNNLDYAEPLEDGHSKQAPSGMVGISRVDIQTYWNGLKV